VIGALIQYGAVATKVKAMYANRLTAEDFAKIAKLRRVPDVVSFLKEHPGWRGAFDGSFDETRRGPLETGLRRYLSSEYMRILHFLDREDRFIVYDRVLRTEMEQIMLFLRYARAGRPSDYRPDLPAFFERHSRIRYDSLTKAVTYEDMLAAVKDTGFYAALARLTPEEEGFPDYTSVEMVMRNHYYRALMDMVGTRYRGGDQELLRRAVGSQADMINITIILRVRKFFPDRLDSVIPLLLPVQYKLTPAFVHRLYSAKTDEAAAALLRESPYKNVFAAHDFAHIEDYYYQFLYDFNRRLLSSGVPSVYTPAAYLNLREVELKNLTTAIECVRYGIQPTEAPTYLFGVPL
jgi:V/A-type H+-transporting ATPase subunit C